MRPFVHFPFRIRSAASAMLLLAACSFPLAGAPNQSPALTPALPLLFEQNQGQFPSAYDFVVRHAGGKIGLSANAVTMALPDAESARPLRIQWQGASAHTPPTPLQPLPTRTHYLRTSAGDALDVRNFARVAYRSILPGVDLEYYGNRDRLEFDFVLAPGVPLDSLRLHVDGADALSLDPEGNLRIQRDGRTILQHRPLIYQGSQDARTPIPSRYVLLAENIVGFASDAYDPSQPLVVDPILEYATFFGGNGPVSILETRTDAAGNVYAFGRSLATVLPGESTPPRRLPGSTPTEIFLTKIAPDLASVVFTTYISWAAPLTNDVGLALAPDGGIYFAYRSSAPIGQIPTNRPVITGSANDTSFSWYKTLLGKLSATGDALLWNTFLACRGSIDMPRLAVDSQSRPILAGSTTCTDYPLSPGAYAGANEATTSGAAAVLAVNADGNGVAYATLIGGISSEVVTHVGVTAGDQPVIAGTTSSSNFPVTAGAVQATLRSYADAFFARFSADGKQLLASTLYGGDSNDTPSAVVVDSQGGITAALDSYSINLSGTGGSFQPIAGSSRAALLRLNPAMDSITWATYFSGVFLITDIAVAPAGETWILGSSLSPEIPLTSQRLLSPNPWAQSYLGRLNANGTIVTFGTALPGLSEFTPKIRLLGTPGNTARILGNAYTQDLPAESPSGTLTNWAADQPRFGTYLMRLNLTDPTICTFAVSPAERQLGWKGGDVEFDISAPAGCPWRVTSPGYQPATVTMLQSAGIGPGKFRVRIPQNRTSSHGANFYFTLLDSPMQIMQEPAACTEPSLSPSSVAFDTLGGIRSVSLTLPDGCPWSAQPNATWFTANLPPELRGSGSQTFSISVGANNFEARASSLSIAGLTLPIQQTAGACTASVTASPSSIPASGGVSSIQVTPSAGSCPWQASATSRVQLGAGSSGTGTASFTATLPANPTNVALAETLHVAGKTVTLTQAAGQCQVSLVPNSTNFGSQAGQVAIRVNATGSACAWFPSTNVTWITIPQDMLNRQGSGEFYAPLAANTTGVSRTGVITILGQSVTITQQTQATVGLQIFAGFVGVPFKANGVTYESPYTLNVPVGTPLLLEAVATEFVTADHELFVFDGWNVGGTQSGLSITYTVQQNNPSVQLVGKVYMGVRVQIVGNTPGDGTRVALAASTPLYKTIGEWQYFVRANPGAQYVGSVTFTAIPGPASRFVRWRTDRQGESANNPATFDLGWPIPMVAEFEPVAGTPTPVAVASALPDALFFESAAGSAESLTASTLVQKIGAAEVSFAPPTVQCSGAPNLPFTPSVTAFTTPLTLTVTLNTAQTSALTPAPYTNCNLRLQPTSAGQQTLVIPLTFTVLPAGSDNPRIQYPVDAAGYRAGPLAIGSIASIFGTKLAPELAHAGTVPLPTELLGTRLVLSREGAEVNCPLFFISPQQINFLIPDEFPVGPATLTLWRNGVRYNSSTVTLTDVRPSLFAANSTGDGPAAGYYVRVDNGNQFPGNLVTCPSGAPPCQPVAIQPPATPDGEIYLVLFGTGIRYRGAAPTANIGGFDAPVVFSGPQGQFLGLDQVNIRVPRSLLGTGIQEIRLRIGNLEANPVGARF
jgi:uncharacterized protein (TIGR03437 family)